MNGIPYDIHDDRYYIHFETKPNYEDLDKFFEIASSKKKVFASSYLFTVPKTTHHMVVFDHADKIFRRRPYLLCRNYKSVFSGETDI